MFKINLVLVLLLMQSVFAQRWIAFNTVIPNANDSLIVHSNEVNKNTLDPDSIKILVWNILKSKKETFAQDFERLQSDKDLIMVQEYFQPTFDLPRYVLREFETTIGTSFRFMGRSDFQEITGVATMARVKSPWRFILKTTSKEPVIQTPKVTLFNQYDLRDTHLKLLAVNIHAINFVNFKHFKEQIDEVLMNLADHNGPIIFAGDFNTWNKKRTVYLKKASAKIGLHEVELSISKRKKWFGHPLDHIFIRGLEVISKAVHNDIESSDHKPMEAELKLIPDYFTAE